MAAKNIAAIDVGSNSIKLLVARRDPSDGGAWSEILREKEMVRLGQETLASGSLSEEAMADGVDCLVRYAALARAAGAGSITAVATCAVREAANGDDFVERVRKETGLRLAVISGEEEARLITRAVRSELPPSCDPLLVLDIGGGSTEVVVAKGDRILLAESLDLGAVRLTDLFVSSDPLSAKDERRLRRAVRSRLGRLRKPVRRAKIKTSVGTSGTILAVAAIAAELRGRSPVGAGHRALERKDVSRIVRLLVKSTARQKLRIPGLEADRRDIVTAGAILLQELMRAFGVEDLLVSERSLRDALVLEVPPAGRGRGAEGNIRRESVSRLARRSGLSRVHAGRVRDLALALFDQTHSLHQLTALEREWLEHAAVLHDIGLSVAYPRHHHHSHYLILHGDLKGFTQDEVELIALVARYHRKAPPLEAHEPFRVLDPWKKPVVEKLAALLRVADALDRTHRGLVKRIRVTLRGKRVHLALSAHQAMDLELWALRKKGRLFEKTFGVDLVARAVVG
ncbi:MAG TPA: Ppx/GppA phosphatase family protein [Thermoanaerobaculia bacterium]|nr:Ppx/GppA phosphatase family protein [Thermoanaerobaculia bacterium]